MRNLLIVTLLLSIIPFKVKAVYHNNNQDIFNSSLNSVSAIELGLVKGVERDSKYGWNLDIDSSVAETIWPQGGSFIATTAAEPILVVSSSANDTAAGTGARTVRLYCITDDFSEVLETVTLNGTTPVASSNSCRYLNRLVILSSGSGNTNEGEITTSQQTSGITLLTIPATIGISQGCFYVVPKGKTALIKRVSFSVVKVSGGGSPLVIFEGYIKSGLTGSMYKPFRKSIDSSTESVLVAEDPYTNNRGEGSIVWWNATSDTANTQVTCRMIILEIDNSQL